MPRNYWMMITNLENFRVTRDLGFTVQGLNAHLQRKAQRIEPGDRILYYIGGKRYFAATATATSRYAEDPAPVWKKEGNNSPWAFKVNIQSQYILDENEFIDACQLAPRLEYVRKWAPEDWYIAFAQSKLHLLPKKDFMLIEEEMRKIRANGNSTRRRPKSHGAHRRRVGQPSG